MAIQGENEQAAVVPAVDLVSRSRDRERLEQIDRNIESARRAYEYGYISEEEYVANIALNKANMDTVITVYDAVTGKASQCRLSELPDKIEGDHTGRWVTGDMQVTLIDSVTGKRSKAYGWEIKNKRAGDWTGQWYTPEERVTVFEADTGETYTAYAWELTSKRQGDHTGRWYTQHEKMPVRSRVTGQVVYVEADQAKTFIKNDKIKAAQIAVERARAQAEATAAASSARASSGSQSTHSTQHRRHYDSDNGIDVDYFEPLMEEWRQKRIEITKEKIEAINNELPKGVVGIGGSGFSQLGGRVSAGVYFVSDMYGNQGIALTSGAGGGSLGAGVGASVFFTNHETIYDLEGWGVASGVSGGPLLGLGVGADYIGSSSGQGIQINVSVSAKPVLESHGESNYTSILLSGKGYVTPMNNILMRERERLIQVKEALEKGYVDSEIVRQDILLDMRRQ